MGMCFIIGFALFFLLSEISQFGLCGRCIESEKRALLKFKASFHDDPYNRLSSWSPKTNCCQWHGIACHNITGHVHKLGISFYDLEAIVVDPSLFELQHLIHLDLSGNNFKGMIPANLGGNLTNLQFLDLSWNHLHTNDMSWVSNLQSLKYLNLSDVYLGEAQNLFQVLHMLPSLLQLQLEGCGLGNLFAPCPSINSTYNARVQVLSLAGNEVGDQIINGFQNWTSLEFLDLYSNSFSSMPMWFGEFKNLVFIDLSWNALCGPIPVVLWNMTSLEYLDLSSNNFSLIPSLLGELKRLRYLDISKNRIIATLMDISVSQILKNKCHLKIFYFDTSNLQGEAFGDFDFSGCIKYDIEELYLGHNKLNGHLPTWVGHLEKLYYLDLSSNSLSGNIPRSLGQLVSLVYLNLSSNSFRGNIPQSLGQLSNLTSLDLSSNSFSDKIPGTLGQLVRLKILDLSNNSFSGNIPQTFCYLVSLMTLDLCHNNLSGEIPNCWRDDEHRLLMEINFSFNKLSGAFPISVSKLSSLLWLHLNNNHLEGKLPLTMKNSKHLRRWCALFSLVGGGNTRVQNLDGGWRCRRVTALMKIRH